MTKAVKCVTLGAGAGLNCDGQVMLIYDLIGISGKQIKFAKDYLAATNSIKKAISNFVADVKTLKLPTVEHSYQ
ncbi:MAG: 3-methyl-2-oxobutanoate hydroxymethyltransferase [Burkholderiales bacterium]|nr:3-methyl-2-oxobutanoate hydroxymethyltransferase [Burkholderiales bacterium]